MKAISNASRQKVGRWKHNRAENSHLPFRQRERAMLRFRRMKTLQKFPSVQNNFNQEHHLVSRKIYRECRSASLAERQSVMG